MQYTSFTRGEVELILQKVLRRTDPIEWEESHKLKENYMFSKYELNINDVQIFYYMPLPLPFQTKKLIIFGKNNLYRKLIAEFGRRSTNA